MADRSAAREPPGRAADLAGRIAADVLGAQPLSIEPLVGGVVARVFRVEVPGRTVVVRLQPGLPAAFEADGAVMPLIAGSGLPVPELLGAGERAGAGYTVTAWVDGTAVDGLPEAGQRAVLPEMLDVLRRIHRIDVSGTTGYGSIGADGNGRSASWRQSLLDGLDPAVPGFWHDWRARLAGSRMPWETFDRWHERLPAVLERVPEARALVHGDYGFSNLLVENDRVSAVIDWTIARYGDPLWDAAYLGFFPMRVEMGPPLAAAFERVAESAADYRYRVAAYRLVLVLDCMRTFARLDDAALMSWVVGLLHGIERALEET